MRYYKQYILLLIAVVSLTLGSCAVKTAPDDQTTKTGNESWTIQELGLPLELRCDLSDQQLRVPVYSKPEAPDKEEQIRTLIDVFQLNVTEAQIDRNWRDSETFYCHDDYRELMVTEAGFKLKEYQSAEAASTAEESEMGVDFLAEEEYRRKLGAVLERMGVEFPEKEVFAYSATDCYAILSWTEPENRDPNDTYITGFCTVTFRGEQMIQFEYMCAIWEKAGEETIISEQEAYDKLPEVVVYNRPEVKCLTITDCRLIMEQGEPFWKFKIKEDPDYNLYVPAR